MRTATTLVGVSITLLANTVHGQATYMELEQTGGVNDMTPDGSVLVGNGASGGYYWTAEDGVTFVGETVTAVSDDGTVIVGNVTDPKFDTQAAGLWNETDGWMSLGGLPTGPCGSLSSGYELSGSGAVAVGLGWEGCSGRGFWWSEPTGMLQLENLGNGNNRASVVSSNGTVAAGFAQGSFSRTPTVWSSDLGGRLLDPPNGDIVGEVSGMSDDGRILLGNWGGEAFAWTCDAAGNGILKLFGSLNPGWSGRAVDIADNGTIVGYDFLGLGAEAWIIPAGGEMQSLSSYLIEQGAEGVPSLLSFVAAISRDGSIVAGTAGGFPFQSGFLATIPVDGGCIADLDASGDVGFNDLLILLSSWGPCPGDK